VSRTKFTKHATQAAALCRAVLLPMPLELIVRMTGLVTHLIKGARPVTLSAKYHDGVGENQP
jgi:hypothetical protein